jgi:Flp pilus assembly protein TadG
VRQSARKSELETIMFNRTTNRDRSTSIRRTARRRHGNALLDAALVLPILLSLTFGTVEYGYFFFVKHSMQGAAREGCRVAIVPTSDNNQVLSAVAAALHAAGLNSSQSSLNSKFTLTTTPTNVGTAVPGTPITVQLDCNWGTVGVRPLGLIGTNKVVRGVTVMRKEG